MTTLVAIGFTVAGSATVAMCSFIFFSVAVRIGSPKIAPRCTARSKETVYNPKAKPKKTLVSSICAFITCRCWKKKRKRKNYKKNDGGGGLRRRGKDDMKNNDEGIHFNIGHKYDSCEEERGKEENQDHVQYRGGPMFGWIPWTLSLSYEQLLKGIPGTGTRKNGMEGSMLRVNLDGIVLLRFHAICLKVAIVGTILAVLITLPINLTADCFWTEGYLECKRNTTLTDYDITTIENIPILEIDEEIREKYGWQVSIFGASFKIFGSNYGSFLGRLYAIVGVSWIMIFYCLRCLKKEWVDALALRRVFYLEGRHWENRIQELNDTVLRKETSDSDDEEKKDGGAVLRKRRSIKKGSLKKQKKKKRVMNDRDPWIPHPEQRDTVPNIELYSVLVGQIPAVPSEIAGEKNVAGDDIKSVIDWQLLVTTTFFDQCVPNQPGFSSSVAAVTILPDAPKLALAWKTWYTHCALLRRLRFIRNLIAEKRHYDIEDYVENYQDQLNETDEKLEKNDDSVNDIDQDKALGVATQDLLGSNNGSQDYLDDYPGAGLSERDVDEYAAIQQRIDYYANVFGAEFNNDNIFDGSKGAESLMTQILSYGPEQTAVYSKEFAMGASKCCPNGCREEKLREQMSLRDLEELEAELEVSVGLSFERLKAVQQSNVLRDESEHVQKNFKEDKKSSDNDVEMQLYSQTPNKFIAPDSQTPYGADFLLGTESAEQNGDHDGALPFQQIAEVNHEKRVKISPKSLQPFPLHVDSSPSFPSQQQMFMTNQGKVSYKDTTAVGSYANDYDDMSHLASWSGNNQRKIHLNGDYIVNDQSSFQNYPSRRRLDTGGFSQMTLEKVEEMKISEWEKVQQAVHDNHAAAGKDLEQSHIASGVWKIPSIGAILKRLWQQMTKPFKKTIDAVDEFKSTSTFAVVTFTSRQAAVAARHALSDGRGVNRWIPVEDIPVPPLADASVCDFCDCRGCCRPVTLTINPNQQYIRRSVTLFMLAVIFVFYTLPLTFASSLVAPEKLNKLIPGIDEAAEKYVLLNNLLSGILPAMFYSVFFALCPVLFKSLSNFGSNAVSVNQSEFIALQYYWWFMLFTAFSGTAFTTMALNFFNARSGENPTFQSVLLSIASTLPTQVSATWLNWIIFRTFCTLPLMYMLNFHTFIFEVLGWQCCIRCVMGGGPGGPIPYRIYIDSGIVFMCVIGLSPVSPLLAPAGLCYFLFCAPLWRRNCIYMYRPNFDTGGIRWPFLSDIFLSAICVAQILLCTTMAIKRAAGPAILSGLVLIPVYLHRRATRKQYYRSYMDAALLQTSRLDGWDNSQPTSKEMREEYRKFLVDAHRAAYVPICLAGELARGLTNEPAVVIPHPNDNEILQPVPIDASAFGQHQEHETVQSVSTPMSGHYPLPGFFQPGASFRRVLNRQTHQDDMSSSTGTYSRPPIMLHPPPTL